MTVDLLDAARAGDGEAFRQLIKPYQRELQLHCYRMLGSAVDAEDAMQEALLAAWQGLGGFDGRASVRTWLYRVATTRCLNARRSASRRSPAVQPWPRPPEPTRLGEVTWLEPYPDDLLEGLADTTPGPDARYEAREAISLAFITAVQRLPPRQRHSHGCPRRPPVDPSRRPKQGDRHDDDPHRLAYGVTGDKLGIHTKSILAYFRYSCWLQGKGELTSPILLVFKDYLIPFF